VLAPRPKLSRNAEGDFIEYVDGFLPGVACESALFAWGTTIPASPCKFRGRLFDTLASSGKPVGVRLDLAICHAIVKTHGGSINADRAGERGCFRVVLPVEG
jgi:hypothetical protein